MMMLLKVKMMVVMMMMVTVLKDGVSICHYPEVILGWPFAQWCSVTDTAPFYSAPAGVGSLSKQAASHVKRPACSVMQALFTTGFTVRYQPSSALPSQGCIFNPLLPGFIP